MCSICIIFHHCTAGRQYAPQLHTVAPINYISSVEHCLLAAMLAVITLLHPESSQNQLQTGDILTYHILRLPSHGQEVCSTEANVILFTSQFNSGDESKDGQWIHPTQGCQNQCMYEDSFFQLIQRHCVADGQQSVEARRTE